MIAVGIDISKAKSTVAVINSDGTILASPFTMAHTRPEMEAFVTYLKGLGEPTTILMEYTGHYHYPVLKKLQDEGFPVCIVNPYQMKKYGDVEIHKAKTDKKDALRIATYALEKSYKLVPYSSMEQKYEDLKFLSRQYNQRISYVTKLKVQLISLLDQSPKHLFGAHAVIGEEPADGKGCGTQNAHPANFFGADIRLQGKVNAHRYADRQHRANKQPRIQPEKDVFVIVADFFRYFDFDKSHLP